MTVFWRNNVTRDESADKSKNEKRPPKKGVQHDTNDTEAKVHCVTKLSLEDKTPVILLKMTKFAETLPGVLSPGAFVLRYFCFPPATDTPEA
jgi:hypothetical protein